MNGNAGLVFIARFKMANCKFLYPSLKYMLCNMALLLIHIEIVASKINFENHETLFLLVLQYIIVYSHELMGNHHTNAITGW